ncbi:MAG: hypothetical protein M0Z41_12595 [Peptococcaceae bacterium]|jgi:flavorubredoxin|nr:hypothetical protein [Peptococcaceae bacterium]
MSSTATILELIRGLQFTGKVGAAFGSYGWSGESPRTIGEKLREGGIQLAQESLKAQYDPTPEEPARCGAFGEVFAAAL